MGYPYSNQQSLDQSILTELQTQTTVLNTQTTSSTNQSTSLGLITDAAATSDTQNTGLIGLTKRLLQRLTTLITSAGNLDTNLGSRSDTSATSDTGTFSLIQLIKRGLSTLTTIATNTANAGGGVPDTCNPAIAVLVANTANTILTPISNPKYSSIDLLNEGSTSIDVFLAANTSGLKFKTLSPGGGWVESWSGPVTVISTGTPTIRFSRLSKV